MTLTKSDLADNQQFNRYAFKIVKEILSTNDKALVANLLDLSKKIVVDAISLQRLIAYATDKTVNITTDAEEKTCNCKCCKVKVRVFETITSITINGKDIHKKEPELCAYITEELGISLERTYASSIIMITKDVEEELEEELEEDSAEATE